MFDIGFWELAIIFVVALLVIGPERLPGVARTMGRWFGKINRFIQTIKTDIDKEIHTDEIKKMLHVQEEIVQEFREVTTPVKQNLQAAQQTTINTTSLKNNKDNADKSNHINHSPKPSSPTPHE